MPAADENETDKARQTDGPQPSPNTADGASPAEPSAPPTEAAGEPEGKPDDLARPAARLRLWRRALALVGIVTSPDQPWHVALRPRLFLLILGGFVLFLLSLGGLVLYSTSPQFCNSCHIMEPYYQAWASSRHNQVACVDCHYPPVGTGDLLWRKFQALSQVAKYVTRTYASKPRAEIEDASCLRSGCHENRLLAGNIVTARGIKFDHKPHLEEKRKGRQLRCVSCHSQMVIGNHMEVTWGTCYLCHLKGKKEGREIVLMTPCLGCHELPTREIQVAGTTVNHASLGRNGSVHCRSCHQDAIHGDAEVTKDRCLPCHNRPEHLARYAETTFIHDHHVTEHHIACRHCHKAIEHGVTTAGTKSLRYDCHLCHTEAHELVRDFYRGKGARGVDPLPSCMYLANVDCSGCHLTLTPAQSDQGRTSIYEASENACMNCHGEKYKGILPAVTAEFVALQAKLKGNLATVKAAVAQQREIRKVPAGLVKVLDQAEYNLDYVGRIPAAHNMFYTGRILRYTNSALRAAARWSQAKVQDTSMSVVINNGYCTTLCHAKVGVNVLRETVKFEGKDMPHAVHVEKGLTCVKCHKFGAHKEIETRGVKVCLRCHKREDLQKTASGPVKKGE